MAHNNNECLDSRHPLGSASWVAETTYIYHSTWQVILESDLPRCQTCISVQKRTQTKRMSSQVYIYQSFNKHMSNFIKYIANYQRVWNQWMSLTFPFSNPQLLKYMPTNFRMVTGFHVIAMTPQQGMTNSLDAPTRRTLHRDSCGQAHGILPHLPTSFMILMASTRCWGGGYRSTRW